MSEPIFTPSLDEFTHSADDDIPELSCPGCGNDLTWDDLFVTHRVCGTCRRHVYIAPRERVALLAPGDRFDPLGPDGEPELREGAIGAAFPAQRSRERDELDDAVLAGIARIGMREAVLMVLDEHAIGSSLGSLTTDRIVQGMELAGTRRLPLVMFVSGGNAPVASGPLSLVQPTRLSAVGAQLHLAGIPTIAVLCQAASSELVGVLAGQCDIALAEPGTRVWERRLTPGQTPGGAVAEDLVTGGLLDAVIDREQQGALLTNVLDLLAERGEYRGTASVATMGAAVRPPTRTATRLPASRWLDHLVTAQFHLHGDRVEADAPTVVAGLGRISGHTVAFAAFDRDSDAVADDSAAVRKLMRIVNLASRLDLPLVVLVGQDRTVAVASAAAMAIAKLSGVLSVVPVPVVGIVVGEVRSPLGRALVTGDRVLSLTGAVFGVDGTAPAAGRLPGAGWSQVAAGEAQQLGLIDTVLAETDAGEPSPTATAQALQAAIVDALMANGIAGTRHRVTDRQRKIRGLGQSTPAGRAARREELREFRDWQRNLARSVDDWRERWDQLRGGQQRLTIQRPDFGEIAARLRTRRAELLERTGLTDRINR